MTQYLKSWQERHLTLVLTMHRVWTFLLIISATAVHSKNDTLCFDQLGCFPLGEPWQSDGRPVPDPMDPIKLDVTLQFYSRPRTEAESKVEIYPRVRLHGARFKASREKTIFIIGAIGQTGHWPIEMKDALLKRMDANVFVVNASTAFHGVDIFQATSNARIVGAELALFLSNLKDKQGLNMKDVYMIGYGLGAHVAGYAGGKLKIGRITGLDPTQLLFEGHPSYMRLDLHDADYVDVLHSDARPYVPDLGFGYINPIGHVDFYLNGGHGQPGCNLPKPSSIQVEGSWTDIATSITTQVVSSIYCAHKRSFKVFIESLTEDKCTYWGHEGTRENFLRAISNVGTEGILSSFTALTEPCDLEKCVPLGLDSTKSKRRGVHIITTASNPPFCIDSKTNKLATDRKKSGSQGGQWLIGLLGDNKS